MSEKERRRLKWINPKFQWRYAFLFVSVGLLVSISLAGVIWFYADQVLRNLISIGLSLTHPLYLHTQKQMVHLLMAVLAIVVFFVGVSFVMGIYVSHRIVGPLYAIKRSLESLRRGETAAARISLREDDEFRDIAEVVNGMVDDMEKRK
jgi:sensor histidine kinase YesM